MAAARRDGLADDAMPPGTRRRVDPHGEGTYVRFECSLFGANVHFVRFDGSRASARLRGRSSRARVHSTSRFASRSRTRTSSTVIRTGRRS